MSSLVLIAIIISAPGCDLWQLRPGDESNEVDLMIRTDGYLDDFLQYDDGTPRWISCAGDYKAVWFDTRDFGLFFLDLGYSEFWFYHHGTMPWPTDQFYAEIWTGLEGASRAEMLHRTVATALHFSPLSIYYYPYITGLDKFWVVANTSLSGNGTPTLLLDGSGNFTGEARSFFSYDMCYWEPFTSGNVTMESTSWGMIKGLYR